MRPTTSALPPGGYGTINRTVRLGQSSALAVPGETTANAATSAAANPTAFRAGIWSPLGSLMGSIGAHGRAREWTARRRDALCAKSNGRCGAGDRHRRAETCHCALMLAALMIGHHLSVSAL